MSRIPTPIRLTPDEARLLEGWLDEARLQAKRAERARIVLFAAEGHPTEWIAAKLGTRAARVSKWRTRYAKYGVQGLKDLKRSGKPARRDRADDDRVLDLLMTPAPAGRRAWTVPALASAAGLEINYIRRVLKNLEGSVHSAPPVLRAGPFRTEVRVEGLFLSSEFLSFAIYSGPPRPDGTLPPADSLAAWIGALARSEFDVNAVRGSSEAFKQHISRLSEAGASGNVHVVYAAAGAPAGLPDLQPDLHNVTFYRTADAAAWLEQIPVWFAVLSGTRSGVEQAPADRITACIKDILQRRDAAGGACFEWLYTTPKRGSRQTGAEICSSAACAG